MAAVFLLGACISDDEDGDSGLSVTGFSLSGGTSQSGSALVRLNDRVTVNWSVSGSQMYRVDVAVSSDNAYSSSDRNVLGRNCNVPLGSCGASGSGEFSYDTAGQYDSYLTNKQGYVVGKFCYYDSAMVERCTTRSQAVVFE